MTNTRMVKFYSFNQLATALQAPATVQVKLLDTIYRMPDRRMDVPKIVPKGRRG